MEDNNNEMLVIQLSTIKKDNLGEALEKVFDYWKKNRDSETQGLVQTIVDKLSEA